MKRQALIDIEIDESGKYCSPHKCSIGGNFANPMGPSGYCPLVKTTLKREFRDSDHVWVRCQACIDAEAAARGLAL